ncbi:MAG: GyrI-like domain-containing protein [Acidobacteriota bacterium]|jgi:hypothetical protein
MKKQDKIDLYRQHKNDYVAPRKPALVNVGAATYLAISGQGAPGGEAFSDKIGALYGVAFTVKMMRKFAGQQDYAVCKLECQWWVKGCDGNFSHVPKEQWNWKLLIRTPDFVKGEELEKAVGVLLERGKTPSVREVRLESFTEGPCVQMLHVGPYEREPETIELMRGFAGQNALRCHGRHHEIYLSDPRRVAPEKLRTILRMPVE